MDTTAPATAYTDLEHGVIDIIAAMAPDRTVRVTDAVTLVDDLGFDSARLLELSAVLERRFDCALDDQRMTAEQTAHDVVALVAAATSTPAPRLSPTRSDALSHIGVRLVYRLGYTALYKKICKHYLYPLMTRRLGQEDVIFLNWGYEEDPPMDLPLDETDEPNRCCIQLYHKTATQVDLSGKDVLEVSCGHGGGASYLVRTLRPASYTGLDVNATGIAFCQKVHNLPSLEFVQGDAQNLPFPDRSFDAVINIEASHIYPNLELFLGEVARVLRPCGHFLYADLRNNAAITAWEAALAKAPMRLVSRRVINDQVLHGLKKNSPRSLELINRYSPALLRRFGREFAAIDGSGLYRDLERGGTSYRIYHFTKA